MGKTTAAILLTLALTVELFPAVAFAATTEGGSLQAAGAQVATQASKSLDECDIQFTDKQHQGIANDSWQLYFVKGKNTAVAPAFDLYLGKAKVPKSKYTVSYERTYYDENKNKEVAKKVKASQLTPSGDPNDKTSCEYRIIVKAKSGSGYAGKTEIAKEYYTVSYYKAKRNVVKAGIPVEKAKTGKKLGSPPTAAGSYVMVTKGKKPYYGTDYILFDIQDKISNTTIAKVKRQKYTGKAVTPKLTVKYRGTTLKEGVDYTVTYKNNVKAGTATATIKGCSKVWTFELPKSRGVDFIVEKDKQRFFSGSRSVTFEIAK